MNILRILYDLVVHFLPISGINFMEFGLFLLNEFFILNIIACIIALNFEFASSYFYT